MSPKFVLFFVLRFLMSGVIEPVIDGHSLAKRASNLTWCVGQRTILETAPKRDALTMPYTLNVSKTWWYVMRQQVD